MFLQQTALEKRLDRYGWEKAATRSEDLEWWADEVWVLQSIWSPQECRLYLTFIVDPLFEGPRQKGQAVWSVEASLEQPAHHGQVSLDFSAGWQERIPAFFAGLDMLRDEWQAVHDEAIASIQADLRQARE
jgi:hypothetical protein